MPEQLTGTSFESIEDAIQNAISKGTPSNHKSGEVLKIALDIGGARGGVEYRVEVRLTS